MSCLHPGALRCPVGAPHPLKTPWKRRYQFATLPCISRVAVCCRPVISTTWRAAGDLARSSHRRCPIACFQHRHRSVARVRRPAVPFPRHPRRAEAAQMMSVRGHVRAGAGTPPRARWGALEYGAYQPIYAGNPLPPIGARGPCLRQRAQGHDRGWARRRSGARCTDGRRGCC